MSASANTAGVIAGAIGVEAMFQALFRNGATVADKDIWFDADRVTLDTGSIAAWTDYVDSGHTLTQATGALRVASAADAALASQLSGAFTGTQYYDGSRPPANYDFFSTGAGFTAYTVFVNTAPSGFRVLWATNNASAFSPGVQAVCSLSTGSSGFFINNATQAIVNSTVTSQYPSGVGVFQSISYAEGVSPEWSHYNRDTLVASGNSIAAPSSVAPIGFRLGGSAAGSLFGASARIAALYAFRRILSVRERQVVRSRIQKKYNV